MPEPAPVAPQSQPSDARSSRGAGAPTLAVGREADGAMTLSFTGRLDSFSVHSVWGAARRAVDKSAPPVLRIDAADVTYCDASGAAMLDDLRRSQRKREGRFELRSFPEEFQPVLDLLKERDDPKEQCPPARGLAEWVGVQTKGLVVDILELVGAVGQIVAALAHCARYPQRIRWRDVLRAAQSVGVNSLPVTLLISGLLGLILSIESAETLHQYGGDILLADLIGISFLRELGPLMTAIVFAARSGSAFAAELGTMKINEEVDALRTMGVDPVRFFVAPRVIAAVVMMPFLTMFANLAGLTGGFVIWSVTLDMSLPSYVTQLQAAVFAQDLYTGLAKSVVFGTLVAGIGCIRGMQTSGSPSAVGESTTSAVVSGIVLIAVSDTVFTIVFSYLDL